jgi:hypothetical protein
METNIMIILGIGISLVLLIIIGIILMKFSKKKKIVLSPEEERIENDKIFKIRGIINDGLNAMMDSDPKRAVYNYEFAVSIYKSLKNRDLKIEQGLSELYRMLPKRG